MKKTKKIISVLLSVALITSVFPLQVSAAGVKPDGTGTVADPYLISTARQLIYFGQLANNAEDKTKLNAKLMADIVLNDGVMTADSNGTEWTPIMGYSSTFDGNGHTISGMYINVNDNDYDAFIGTGENATIKNLGIINSYVAGDKYIGGIAGKLSGTIDNCYYDGIAYVNSANTTDGYMGNVVAYFTGDLTNCTNTSDINIDKKQFYAIGGIAGYVSGTIRKCKNQGYVNAGGGFTYGKSKYTGGVVGYLGTAEITECYNTASVASSSAETGASRGGIAGYAENVYVENCHNTGGLGNPVSGSYMNESGIIGDFDNTNGDCIIVDSSNTCSTWLKSERCAGIKARQIIRCYNTGSGYYQLYTKGRDTLISYSYGSGKSYGCDSDVKGGLSAVTIDHSYYYRENMSASSQTKEWIQTYGRTKEQFNNGAVAYHMGWYQNVDLGEPDELPIPDDTHYKVYYSFATKTYTNKKGAISGFCGDDVFYSFDINTGKLELDGSGETNVYNNNAPWYSDAKYIYEVNITGDVIVDKSIFDGMTALQTIYVERGTEADNASLYPAGVSVKYPDGSEIDSPDPAPDKTVTVHYDSVYKKKYSAGIYSDGYKCGKNDIYSALTEADKEFGVSSGETLSIKTYDTTSEEREPYSLTYAEIAANNITDIWISNDVFYTEKPSAWGEDVTLSVLGDVDGDGDATVLDATHILKKASNEEYKFPLENN